jgi:tRNA modification GTPase
MPILSDTIAAIATPAIASAIGIIRMSGAKTLEICSGLLTKQNKKLSKDYISNHPRLSIYCNFGSFKSLDTILFTYYPSPNSYTGEDTAEFFFHGNPILLSEALKEIFQLGARPADRGEFTKRAFLNGKIELTQAEAVRRMIEARSAFELELAQKNYYGEISRLSSRLRSDLMNLKAECEAEIDFSTEDLTFESLEQRKNRIHSVQKLCKNTIESSERARTTINTQKIVIFGEPNVGKSSLLNILIGRDRAIVSEIPGTTRDFLTEDFSLNGVPLKLVDTAGIRETTDTIEKLGIERSKSELESANCKLFLIDLSKIQESIDFLMSNKSILNHSIIVGNKFDLVAPSLSKVELQKIIEETNSEYVEISCTKKIGISSLIDCIQNRFTNMKNDSEYVFLEDRNLYLFQEILKNMHNTISLIDQAAPVEIYIKEIDSSLDAIGMINGRIDSEEILGRIFSLFCVGK